MFGCWTSVSRKSVHPVFEAFLVGHDGDQRNGAEGCDADGIAGALYVPQVGIINPSEMSPANSIEIAIWTAVGGRGTLVGPAIGAAVVNLGKSWFTQALPEYWLYALGLLFILSTLFLPKGIAGWIGARFRRS